MAVNLEAWTVQVKHEKAVYHTLNKLSVDVTRKVRCRGPGRGPAAPCRQRVQMLHIPAGCLSAAAVLRASMGALRASMSFATMQHVSSRQDMA